MNQDKERAEFEAWYRSKYGAIGSYEQWKLTDVVYMFIAWQASAARHTARFAELEEGKDRAERALLRAGYTNDMLEVNVARLKDILELAKNGLEWFFNAYPGGVSEADHEIIAQIDEAMKGGA